MLAVATEYEAVPYRPVFPERLEIISHITSSLVRHDPIFQDDAPACEQDYCGACDRCHYRLVLISALLVQPDARFWEVWKGNDLLPCGVIYLTDIDPGVEARAHYVFFDGKLTGKTPLIRSMVEAWFTDSEEWRALRRLNLEIPELYFGLANHAKTIGFGGPFEFVHRSKGERHGKPRTVTKKLPVEGIKRKRFRKGGKDWDVLCMGLLNT